MKKIIHSLRNRPEEEKKHIARLITILGAIFLIAFWSFTLKDNLTDEDTKARLKNDFAPFGELKANVIDQSGNVLLDESN